MTPLQPRDAFGTTHVAALLLLSIDALARDIEAMTEHGETRPFVEPDEFDFALAGLCALAERVRCFGERHRNHPSDAPTSWPGATERMLR